MFELDKYQCARAGGVKGRGREERKEQHKNQKSEKIKTKRKSNWLARSPATYSVTSTGRDGARMREGREEMPEKRILGPSLDRSRTKGCTCKSARDR
jgi:hypothetical protein